MRKILLFTMGALLILGSLTGCGKKESASTETKSGTVSEKTETTEDTPPTEENDEEEEVTDSSAEAQEYDFGYSEIEGGIRINNYFQKGENEIVVIPEEIDGKKVLEIGEIGNSVSVFSQDNTLKELTIPDTVQVIGNDSFSFCDNLEKVNFGSGLKQIGEKAFESCISLKGVEFSEGLETIGYAVFLGDLVLEKAILPTSVTSIEDANFPACSENIVIVTPSGSYAEEYAKSLELKVENN